MKVLEKQLAPKWRILFTKEDADLLVLCAKRHHDYTCRTTLEWGHLIFVMRERLSVGPYTEMMLTSDDLILLCKVVEELGADEPLKRDLLAIKEAEKI
jgi:hypothetical protein